VDSPAPTSPPTVDFDPLAAQVTALQKRGSPEYEEARAQAIWNKRLADVRAPDAVVRCSSAEEVAAAIRFAREHGLQVSLRGSGHSYHAAALCDGGLLLDLGALDFVEIDAENRRARVGPGARGGDLVEALAEQDLAFPIGHCASVAMGGFILSGGIGWNYGAWGPACRNLAAIELVTAEGEILRVSADEHADLFWAARGAGCSFFAAVTAYELELHPLPESGWLWTATFTAESAPALADWLTAATAASHPASEIMCLVGPDFKMGEPSVTIRAVGIGDSEEQARDRVSSFHSPPPEAELMGEPEEKAHAFADLHKLSHMPEGKRVAADQAWCDATLGEMLLAVYHLAGVPKRSSTVNLISPGGNGEIPFMPDAAHAALSAGGGASAGVYAMWDEADDDALHCGWVRDVDAALAPVRSARYVGEADLTAGPERLRECFSADAFARLEDLRGRYDPEHLFQAHGV
jgi:FAD/FMN-containing dehydrogenase